MQKGQSGGLQINLSLPTQFPTSCPLTARYNRTTNARWLGAWGSCDVDRAEGGSLMQLFDPKLAFAKPLIEHWCSIRNGLKLVPREADLDPRQLQRVLPSLSIMDISHPDASIIAVMGKDIKARYPAGVSQQDWYDFIPEEGAAVAREAVRRLIDTPCGVYYRYKITDGSTAVETGEALALPMLTHKSDKPTAWISVARIEGEGGLIVLPITLDELSVEFVDIGAGVSGGVALRK